LTNRPSIARSIDDRSVVLDKAADTTVSSIQEQIRSLNAPVFDRFEYRTTRSILDLIKPRTVETESESGAAPAPPVREAAAVITDKPVESVIEASPHEIEPGGVTTEEIQPEAVPGSVEIAAQPLPVQNETPVLTRRFTTADLWLFAILFVLGIALPIVYLGVRRLRN
ncbi:MAG: hypothetical protein HN368_01985, partial [Spirochaetales bacterium]|nr:hypothetical protein [Spirochaetales bacterium]